MTSSCRATGCSRETFTRALAVLGLGLMIVLSATMVLGYIEVQALEAGKFSFLDLFFEATSAFATVGLTSAGTPGLHPASWVVLIPAMYLGRVGPAAFAISLAMRSAKNARSSIRKGELWSVKPDLQENNH